MDTSILKVGDDSAGERLDRYLSDKGFRSRSRIKRLIDECKVFVNGEGKKANYKIKRGDIITLVEEKDIELRLIPEPIPIEILYEDRDVIVVNKPAGLVVYPAAGHRSGTLLNAVAWHCNLDSAIGGPLRPGIVHRLDKDTSGIMVVAKSEGAYYSLIKQFKERSIRRTYAAVVYGRITQPKGEIKTLIGRSAIDRKKMTTKTSKGKEAVTRWTVKEYLHGSTLMEVSLGTGRTHQIRVHFASMGHPVLGDKTYGSKSEIMLRGNKKVTVPRQLLHANKLGFTHPSGKQMDFEIKIPEDMSMIIEILRESDVTQDSYNNR